MHFYWLLCVIIWSSAWLGTLVYPTFLLSGEFSWGYVITVFMYKSINILVTIPFVVMALLSLRQLLKNIVVQLKYGKIFISMVVPAILSFAGGIYLLVNITALSLSIVILYSILQLIFGTKKVDTTTHFKHISNSHK